jgi:salicylate hydroxylase
VRAGHGGATLSSLPSRAFRDRYKMPWRVIHRSDLQAALADACRGHSGVTLLTGTTVRETLVQENGLLVRIGKPDGIDVIPAAALIGADGVWSSTRERIPGGATAKPSGMTAWRATIAADIARDIAPMDRVMLWLGHEGHVVHYPIAHGAALNVVAIVPQPWDKQGWSAPGDRGEIQQHFSDWTSDLRRVLSAPLAWHKHAIATVDPRGAWCDGRVALLGDAAHAMHPYLAQGAAMTMEDGAVLAAALRGATDVPAALRAYEAERKARVAKVAKAAVATAAQYHATGIMRLGRNAALTLAGPRLILQRNDWIYRWTVDARG